MTHALRLARQLLAGPPAETPAAVARRLLAVQAQDPRGFRLAVRARTRGLSAADVDRALTDERSVAVTWLNRGTLHLVSAEDLRWLHALTAPPRLTGTLRRLSQEGVGPAAADRGVAAIARALASEGPLGRDALRRRLERAGVPTGGQAVIHLLALAALRGRVVRGPVLGGEHAYVLTDDWLGPAPRVDRARALGELARRYLRGHGPAGERDLAWWAGLPLRDARAALQAVAAEVRDVGGGLVDLADEGREAPPPPPRLLGPFDPLLLGRRSRAPVLGDHATVVVRNGMVRAIALVDGRAAGTWTTPARRVRLTPFAPLPHAVAAALAREADEVERFLGLRA